MNIIEVKNLNFKIKDQIILKNISFNIKRGSFTSILGSNGSGKSTLALAITKVFDEDIKEIKINNIHNKRIVGLILENPDNQIIGTTVKDDIAFGLQNKKLSREEIDKKIDLVLNKMNILNLKNKEVITLSGGQKQKLAVASLLALDYEVYIFDEATSMLDFSSKKVLYETIESLIKSGKTVIQITHFMEEAQQSEKTILLQNGEIIFNGITKDLMNNKKLLEDNNLIEKW